MIIKEKEKFIEELERWHDMYDIEEYMIQRPFSTPGYHTTLIDGMVHPTRESLRYAVALFDIADTVGVDSTGTSKTNTFPNARTLIYSEKKELFQRGASIVEKVISLQDSDKRSKTYGIWPWFLEEPLKDMSPPDWNWANFCGVQLLQLIIDHQNNLTPKLHKDIKESIIHATNSIIKRGVGPNYTNIAIMSVYVTIMAGQEFRNKEFYEYGLRLLQEIHDNTLKNGITEYNSPTYTMIALREITRLSMHIQDEKIVYAYVEPIHDKFWNHMARHFHVSTQQWAGPHSRSYSTLATRDTLSFIQMATGIKLLPSGDFSISLEDFRVWVKCPEKYKEYFSRPRFCQEVEVFDKSEKQCIQGVTYLTPQYTLGTISYGEMWNQRRNLLAYWGGKKPSYICLRFLHDNNDYSSAILLSTQNENKVLGGICFATDLGDTHISLDKLKDGKISAMDLRMRFEFGGAISNLEMPDEFCEGTPTIISHIKTANSNYKAGYRRRIHTRHNKDIYIGIQIIKSIFNEQEIQYEFGWERGKACLDVMFYHGKRRILDFTGIQMAFSGFALVIDTKRKACIDSLRGTEYSGLYFIWPEASLTLHIPQKPDKSKGIMEMHNTWNTSGM